MLDIDNSGIDIKKNEYICVVVKSQSKTLKGKDLKEKVGDLSLPLSE